MQIRALSHQTAKLLIRAASVAVLLAFLSAAMGMLAAAQDKKHKPEQQQKSDDDAVRLHSDLVVVNLIVTDAKGQYAHGLVEKDFTILEDDRAQPINSFFSEEAPFAAAILIDTSGSMDYKFSLARAAAASFVDHIRDNDQVAVYGFNNEIKLFQDFSDLRDIS